MRVGVRTVNDIIRRAFMLTRLGCDVTGTPMLNGKRPGLPIFCMLYALAATLVMA